MTLSINDVGIITNAKCRGRFFIIDFVLGTPATGNDPPKEIFSLSLSLSPRILRRDAFTKSLCSL